MPAFWNYVQKSMEASATEYLFSNGIKKLKVPQSACKCMCLTRGSGGIPQEILKTSSLEMAPTAVFTSLTTPKVCGDKHNNNLWLFIKHCTKITKNQLAICIQIKKTTFYYFRIIHRCFSHLLVTLGCKQQQQVVTCETCTANKECTEPQLYTWRI